MGKGILGGKLIFFALSVYLNNKILVAINTSLFI